MPTNITAGLLHFTLETAPPFSNAYTFLGNIIKFNFFLVARLTNSNAVTLGLIVIMLFLINGENRYSLFLTEISMSLFLCALTIFLISFFLTVRNRGVYITVYLCFPLYFLLLLLQTVYLGYNVNRDVDIYLAVCSFFLFSFISFIASINHRFCNISLQKGVFNLAIVFFAANFAYTALSVIDIGNFKFTDFYGLYENISKKIGDARVNLQRPTGTARVLFVLCLATIALLYKAKSRVDKFYLSLLVTVFLIGSLLFQARTVEVILYGFLILLVLIKLRNNFNYKIAFGIFICAFCVHIFYDFVNYMPRSILSEAFNDNNPFQVSGITENKINYIDAAYDYLNRISSGRLALWKAGVLYLDQCFWGCGVNSDRFFLRGNNIHNGYLYVFISGGIFSCLYFLVFINGFSLSKSIYFSEPFYAWLLGYFSIRIFFENGFLIFGFDQILFSLFLYCWYNYKKTSLRSFLSYQTGKLTY